MRNSDELPAQNGDEETVRAIVRRRQAWPRTAWQFVAPHGLAVCGSSWRGSPSHGAVVDVAQAGGIIVLHVGEGADELFMGCSSYRALDRNNLDFPFLLMLPPTRHPYLEVLFGAFVIDECREVYNTAFPIAAGIPC